MTKISVGLGVSRHRLNNRGRRVGPSYRKAAVITAINRHRRLWANGELPVFSGQPATALQQLKPSMRQKRNGLGVCDAMGPCNPRATHTDGPLTERRLRVQVALAQPDAGCLVSAAILGGACFVVLYEISPCWVPEEMDCGRFPGRCARTQCSNRRVRALSGLRFHTCPQLIRFAVKSTESYLWLPCGRIEAHQSTALTAWGCWVLRWVPGRPEWPPGAYLRGGTPASEISNHS